MFATGTNQALAKQIAAKAGWEWGKAELDRFADGEVRFVLKEDVAGQESAVLGSTSPPGENLLELVTIINTLKINGAKSVIAVIPYFGYAKSDRVERAGLPVNARLFAQFFKAAGADKVIAVNLHSEAVESFFKLPLVHLSSIPLLADHFARLGEHSAGYDLNLMVATPDLGGEKRAREFADFLGVDHVVVVEKRRPADDQAEVVKVRDGVEGKDVVVVDDMVQTGGTLLAAGEALKKMGAKDIYIAVTHFVFSAGAVEKLAAVPYFKEIVITDTITPPENLPEKFKVLTVEPLLVNALKIEQE